MHSVEGRLLNSCSPGDYFYVYDVNPNDPLKAEWQFRSDLKTVCKGVSDMSLLEDSEHKAQFKMLEHDTDLNQGITVSF